MKPLHRVQRLGKTAANAQHRPDVFDVIVIGAGPAGVTAALCAAELGAHTALVTSAEFGGMAANDGPVPVRALAFAARLVRDAHQLNRYGISATEPVLHYDRLLGRVREIVRDVRAHSTLREKIDEQVTLYEYFGAARFTGPHTVEGTCGARLDGQKFIICTGGVSRRLAIPGIEFTSSHSDVWKLTEVPPSMLIVGAGSTGVQIASMFHAFGTRIQLYELGPRILPSEDESVASAVTAALREAGVMVRERLGSVRSFERTPTGVQMNFRSSNGNDDRAEAALAVVAAGWVPDAAALNLPAAGVELESRGTIKVDRFLQTSAPHIFAAGDVTGRLMLVPGAIEDGFVAATNAVRGPTHPLQHRVTPSGSFTHPEYSQVGLTEAKAREIHEVVTTMVPFKAAVRPIIEGRTFGFCKLITDRRNNQILGCHVVGERAVEITQLAAIAMAARMPVDELARVAISFPTYAEVLVHAAVLAAIELNLPLSGQAEHVRHGMDFSAR